MKNFNEKPTWFRPISDVGFHKIFCTEGNDELVLQLLNAVIDDRKIVGFTRLDPVHQINNDTCSTFDLYCTCDDGARVIVECQNVCDAREFMNRALAYSALAILDQARANWHYRFDKIYFVGLMNFRMWKNRNRAFTKVGLYTADDHILANANYLQIFVELPKLAPERDSEDFGNLFLRALRDIGKSRVRQEEYADKRLDPLFNASDYNHLSDKEQRQYEDSMTTVEDLMSYARVQRAEGVEEGMERGIEEGMEKGKEEVAKAMKADGVPVETIAKYSGLSEADIRAL